jgi:hypothetical protein
VETCIIPEFNDNQPLLLFLETRVNKAMKKRFQTLINSFSLVVSLRMIGCAHFQAGSRHFKQCLPLLVREDWITIRNDGSMEFINHIHENRSHIVCSICMGRWNEMSISCKFITMTKIQLALVE